MTVELGPESRQIFRSLKPGIMLSRVNSGVFDPRTAQLVWSEIKISPESDNRWLPGEIAVPIPDSSPTIIIGGNENSDLWLGFGLRTVSEVVEEGEDRSPALSLKSQIASYLKDLSKATGITHIIERDDETLPNSVLQISLPRRGAVVVAYGRAIDIVAKDVHDNGRPAKVTTPLQGIIDDYSEEDKKYNLLHPVVMWRDEKAGMTLKDELNWRTKGQEVTTLPENDSLIIFTSAEKRYAIRIIQKPNLSKTPYHWDRILTYRTYSLDTADDAIFDDLCPKSNADDTESV